MRTLALSLLLLLAPIAPPPVPFIGGFWAPGLPDSGIYLSLTATTDAPFTITAEPGLPAAPAYLSPGTYCVIDPGIWTCEAASLPWAPDVESPSAVLLRFEQTPDRVTITQAGASVVWEPYKAPPGPPPLPVVRYLPLVGG